ncbi:hypothetical protein H9P43_009936 [Blastocladiella emersonii ATCC 22665]|nr:hypothetical protein H9P43_009936 [Blastocladiella emersonii ATCC 22665]
MSLLSRLARPAARSAAAAASLTRSLAPMRMAAVRRFQSQSTQPPSSQQGQGDAMTSGPTWSAAPLATLQAQAAPAPVAGGPQAGGPGGQQQVEDESPYSVPMYMLSALLIGGSIYYVGAKSSERIDLDTTNTTGPRSGEDPFGVSLTADEDDAREARLLSTTGNLWVRLQNLWMYPSAVRSPLRSAVLYHHYVPDAAKAEAFYLTAWDAAKAGGHLDLEAGIALQLARFYADQTAPVPALRWYHRGLESLVAWYADAGERNNHRRAAVPWHAPAVASAKLERVAAILAHMARAAAYLEANPESAAAAVAKDAAGGRKETPNWGTDRYYSMALGTFLLASAPPTGAEHAHAHAAVQAHLGHLLRGSVPPPTVSATAGSPNPPAGLVALLEEMATHYASRHQPAYAAALRRTLLGYMPGTDARDVYCRRASVMNNLAGDLVAGYEHAQAREGGDSPAPAEYLAEAKRWLVRARDSTDAKSAPECGECRAAALNNLGRVSELMGDFDAAARALRESLLVARGAGLVDARREAQANLDRVLRKSRGE